jgi:hypothetical protein
MRSLILSIVFLTQTHAAVRTASDQVLNLATELSSRTPVAGALLALGTVVSRKKKSEK